MSDKTFSKQLRDLAESYLQEKLGNGFALILIQAANEIDELYDYNRRLAADLNKSLRAHCAARHEIARLEGMPRTLDLLDMKAQCEVMRKALVSEMKKARVAKGGNDDESEATA